MHSIDRRVVYMLESWSYEADNTFLLAAVCIGQSWRLLCWWYYASCLVEGTIGEQAVLLELAERFTVKASGLMSTP